jgi:hypothetical protein
MLCALLARGGRRGRAPAAALVYLPGMGQGRLMGGGGCKYPGCLNTTRVKFASAIIMSDEGESVESADVVERRRSSEAAP